MASPFTGILYPARLPTFHRIDAPAELKDLVQWFWIPEWDIEPGRTSRQQVISFPTSNLVVLEHGVELAGPTTQASHRDLTGKGWAVGALLRPAAMPVLAANPGSLRDTSIMLFLPELQAKVVGAMRGAEPQKRRLDAVAAFTAWFLANIPAASADGLLANTLMDVVASRPDVMRIEDVAQLLAVSPRTLQRLAKKYIGLGPAALIRRRRLQEAADRTRTDPDTDLAAIAAELGYADQSHLANDFQASLGFTPSSYRHSTQQH